MNDKFDELVKGMAQSVTRRQALRRFGVGVAGLALVAFGLANRAQAKQPSGACKRACDRCRGYPWGCNPDDYYCLAYCSNCCTPPLP